MYNGLDGNTTTSSQNFIPMDISLPEDLSNLENSSFNNIGEVMADIENQVLSQIGNSSGITPPLDTHSHGDIFKPKTFDDLNNLIQYVLSNPVRRRKK